jgi:hypothetical protein
LGYYDDGEEHVGVGVDAHEAKKRIQEISDDADKKLAKKARKLGEVQRNSLMPFVKTGAPVSRESITTTVSSKAG